MKGRTFTDATFDLVTLKLQNLRGFFNLLLDASGDAPDTTVEAEIGLALCDDLERTIREHEDYIQENFGRVLVESYTYDPKNAPQCGKRIGVKVLRKKGDRFQFVELVEKEELAQAV